MMDIVWVLCLQPWQCVFAVFVMDKMVALRLDYCLWALMIVRPIGEYWFWLFCPVTGVIDEKTACDYQNLCAHWMMAEFFLE